MQGYWHKQTTKQPLFPDLLWSRPETKNQAGKLLIVGGNAHGFAAPADAYAEADRAGVGLKRVLLPQHVKALLPSPLAKQMEFAPSNASGSFARAALAELLDAAGWADGVLLAGDLGRNSETAIVLEQLASKYRGPLTITQDAADYFTKSPLELLRRPNTALVISFAQAQKVAASARFASALRYEMDLTRLVEALHHFTTQYPITLVTTHHENLIVATGGQVSTTQLQTEQKIWRVKTAAHVATWQLQNPDKPFAAVSTAILKKGQGD